jgi:hypothetical protein
LNTTSAARQYQEAFAQAAGASLEDVTVKVTGAHVNVSYSNVPQLSHESIGRAIASANAVSYTAISVTTIARRLNELQRKLSLLTTVDATIIVVQSSNGTDSVVEAARLHTSSTDMAALASAISGIDPNTSVNVSSLAASAPRVGISFDVQINVPVHINSTAVTAASIQHAVAASIGIEFISLAPLPIIVGTTNTTTTAAPATAGDTLEDIRDISTSTGTDSTGTDVGLILLIIIFVILCTSSIIGGIWYSRHEIIAQIQEIIAARRAPPTQVNSPPSNDMEQAQMPTTTEKANEQVATTTDAASGQVEQATEAAREESREPYVDEDGNELMLVSV